VERSISGFTDPIVGVPNGVRRRSVRHKLHTPVYASFNGPQTGMVVDLSELLDLNEDGFAVQTSQKLDVRRPVSVCLDLPETKSYIHSSGQVVWSDDSGRGGIRFSGLSGRSREILKEWLFANLLIACSNYAARMAQIARSDPEKLYAPASSIFTKAEPRVSAISHGIAMLASLEDVRRQVTQTGDNFDAALQLITDRALGLTGASGAALAFLIGGEAEEKMVCRALAGRPTPPLGAPVDAEHGITGECIRSGQLVLCENTENDSRVDPDVCRAMGIGSLMAAAVKTGDRVIGLLEVFSPHARGFTAAEGTVLTRLVEMIPQTRRESSRPETSSEVAKDSPADASQAPAPEAGSIEFALIHATREAFWEPEPEVQQQKSQPTPKEEETVSKQMAQESETAQVDVSAPREGPRLVYRTLIGLVVAVVSVALGYALSPLIEKHWADSPQAAQGPPKINTSPATTAPRTPVGRSPQANSLEEVQKLAGQGNADAQWQLGARYHNGEDVPKDDVQAMQWFLRAAEQGHVTAQSTLGAYYWAGRGVPQDLSKAYFWSALALAQGDENSKARLEGLASQMTRQQVSEARQQAEVWLRSHTGTGKAEESSHR
jgi:hypothetical protein